MKRNVIKFILGCCVGALAALACRLIDEKL